MRGWARRWALWALVTVALGVSAPAALATAGAPDPSFSGDGRVAVVPPSDGTFVARAVALQPDGRILVAGFSCNPVSDGDGTCLAGGGSSFRIARLTRDGGLDAEFGRGGFVTTPIGSRSQAYDVEVRADGTIVAGGLARVGDRDRFAVAQYDARGALVPGFGDGGVVTVPVGVGFGAISSLAFGPAGTLYAAGQAVDSAGRRRMAIARFTAAGALDAGWGSGGTRLLGPSYGYALGLAVGADGGVTLGGVGSTTQTPGDFRVGLARVDGAGAADPGFAGTGSTTYAVGTSASFANALIGVGADGWLAGGVSTGADNRQAMTALRGGRDGALDPSFGTGGVTQVPGGDGAAANDVVGLPDGRSVLVGQVAVDGTYRFAAARLTAGGAIDPTFGTGGFAATGFDGFTVARAIAGVVQPDGKLVSVGVGCVASAVPDCTGGTSVLLVARQEADPSAPAPPAAAPPTGPSEPVPSLPPETPSPARPSVKVAKVAARITRKRLVTHGIRLRVRTSAKVRADATLTGRRRAGKHRTFVLARDRVTRYRRSWSLRLKPGRRAARAARRGRLRVRLRVRTAAGARVTKTFTVRLR